MDLGTLNATEVRQQLDRILASDGFRSSTRLRAFLEFTVDCALTGQTDHLKETVLGPSVCGRSVRTFDPRTDPVVRVTASRLRHALQDYYGGPGLSDPVLISYPTGTYAPAIALRTETPPAHAASPEMQTVPRRRWIPSAPGFMLSAAVALIAGIAGYSLRSTPRALDRTQVRFRVLPPDGAPVVNVSMTGPSQISPDGKHIVFTAGSPWSLLVHSLTTMKTWTLEGSTLARYPFWSPDSRSIAFFQDGKLRKASLNGGPPVTLCEAPGGKGGSWSARGVIVFAPSSSSGLYAVPAGGGKARPVTRLDEAAGDIYQMWPYFLPDGRRFLFTVLTEPAETSAIYVASTDGSQPRRRIWPAYTNAAYVPLGGNNSGLLLYGQRESLIGVPFDPERLATLGDPVPQEQAVGVNVLSGLADYSVSNTGTLVFRGGPTSYPRELRWLDRSGKLLSRRLQPGLFRNPQLSPDGATIAVSASDTPDGNWDIWLVNEDSESVTRLAFDPQSEFGPVWSPDGSSVAYAFGRDRELRRKPTHGAGSSELLFASAEFKYPTGWSPDGRYLLFNRLEGSTLYDIWALPVEGERKPFPVVRTAADELDGRISPDGRWISYSSNESGNYQVYVESFPPSPGNRRRVQISSKYGFGGRWRRDGSELYYCDGGSMMAMRVETGTEFVAGKSRTLFDVSRIFHSSYGYDVAPDGSRFLFSASTGEEMPSPSPTTVVLRRFSGPEP